MARLRAFIRAAAVVAAILLLNAALTFHNDWPTPAVRWPLPPELSIELAAALLLLAAAAAWRARRASSAPPAPGLLAAVTLTFVLGRYAEVTAPALYGRPVNLYWDAPHLGGVLRMLLHAGGPVFAVLVVAGALLALLSGWWLLRVVWRPVLLALATPAWRRAAAALGAAVLGLGLAQSLGHTGAPARLRVATPVAATFIEQARLILHAWRGVDAAGGEAAVATTAGASSSVLSPGGGSAATDAAFHALAGDDLLLVFLESYGSLSWTDPVLAARLAPLRAALTRAVARTGRTVVSTTVVAPTFGGNSWLSHLSLLAGREIRDPGLYARTMQGVGRSLVGDFGRAGYRTVALMPGLRNPWPEGAWYGFDAILDAAAIDYRGPAFGWWRIPDQYALVRLPPRERGAPQFVFFPTISTHAPFRPTPPYQPDWTRLRGPGPYGPEAAAALAQVPEWTNLAPAYGDALAYALQWLAGYLDWRADAPLTLVILGDHQPPAAVGGPSGDWGVPVHVITRRAAIADALCADGFVPGLAPPRIPLGRMHDLRPRLLAAFRGHARRGDGSSVDASRVDVAGCAARPVVEQPPP